MEKALFYRAILCALCLSLSILTACNNRSGYTVLDDGYVDNKPIIPVNPTPDPVDPNYGDSNENNDDEWGIGNPPIPPTPTPPTPPTLTLEPQYALVGEDTEFTVYVDGIGYAFVDLLDASCVISKMPQGEPLTFTIYSMHADICDITLIYSKDGNEFEVNVTIEALEET